MSFGNQALSLFDNKKILHGRLVLFTQAAYRYLKAAVGHL